jgi:hypothetical protein
MAHFLIRYWSDITVDWSGSVALGVFEPETPRRNWRRWCPICQLSLGHRCRELEQRTWCVLCLLQYTYKSANNPNFQLSIRKLSNLPKDGFLCPYVLGSGSLLSSLWYFLQSAWRLPCTTAIKTRVGHLVYGCLSPKLTSMVFAGWPTLSTLIPDSALAKYYHFAYVRPRDTASDSDKLIFLEKTQPPVLVSMVIISLWTWVDIEIRRMQPYIDLIRGNAPPERSLLLDYTRSKYVDFPYTSFTSRWHLSFL